MTAWLRVSACAILAIAVSATPALAQRQPRTSNRPVPDKGMTAVTLSLGASMPSDEFLENGLFLGVAGEWYKTPRISIKAQIGGSWWSVVNHQLDDKVSPMHITGSGVYNWEHGKWHPYAQAGIGWYRYRFGEGSDAGTDSKVGMNIGGGVEWFLNRHDTVTGDLTIHLVPGDVQSDFWIYTPARYWTLAAGYKHYFGGR